MKSELMFFCIAFMATIALCSRAAPYERLATKTDSPTTALDSIVKAYKVQTYDWSVVASFGGNINKTVLAVKPNTTTLQDIAVAEPEYVARSVRSLQNLLKRVNPGQTNGYGRVREGQTFNDAHNIPAPASYSIRIIGRTGTGGNGNDAHVYDLDLSMSDYAYYVPNPAARNGNNPLLLADRRIGNSAIVQFGANLRGYHYVVFSQHHDVDDRPESAQIWAINRTRYLRVGRGTGMGPNFNILSARYMTANDYIREGHRYGDGQAHFMNNPESY